MDSKLMSVKNIISKIQKSFLYMYSSLRLVNTDDMIMIYSFSSLSLLSCHLLTKSAATLNTAAIRRKVAAR